MPPLLSIVGFLKWPVTIAAAALVFGTAITTALSMLHDSVAGRPAAAVTLKASVATPIIRMPDTPVVSPGAARAKLASLTGGRRYAGAALAGDTPAANQANPARMIAASGLIVRSKPMKASAAVGTIARGESVEVRSKQGGWLLVSGPAGQTGWVFGRYLKPATAG